MEIRPKLGTLAIGTVIILYGTTENGTTVPIQVTEDGRLVVMNPGVQPGDDINCNSITASASVSCHDELILNSGYQQIYGNGGVSNAFQIYKSESDKTRVVNIDSSGHINAQKVTCSGDVGWGSDPRNSLNADGSANFESSIQAASNTCGFTATGELFFTSRGDRWKAVVQNQNVMAEPYTRSMELKEKAGKVPQPKTQDIVPED